MNEHSLCKFGARQLNSFYPEMSDLQKDIDDLGGVIGFALKKYSNCARHIRLFRDDTKVDPLHIMKYPIFLILLSREVHLRLDTNNSRLKDRIHALNKALHGCSVSFKIEMPSVFFLNYATNIVLVNTEYGNNLVLYHGVTVGAYRNKVPTIGSNVVLMPNVLVSGNSVIGDNVVVSSGVQIVNQDVPSGNLVYDGGCGKLIFVKKDTSNYIDTYLQKINNKTAQSKDY